MVLLVVAPAAARPGFAGYPGTSGSTTDEAVGEADDHPSSSTAGDIFDTTIPTL